MKGWQGWLQPLAEEDRASHQPSGPCSTGTAGQGLPSCPCAGPALDGVGQWGCWAQLRTERALRPQDPAAALGQLGGTGWGLLSSAVAAAFAPWPWALWARQHKDSPSVSLPAGAAPALPAPHGPVPLPGTASLWHHDSSWSWPSCLNPPFPVSPLLCALARQQDTELLSRCSTFQFSSQGEGIHPLNRLPHFGACPTSVCTESAGTEWDKCL